MATTPGDTAATGAYLRADYELNRAFLKNAEASDAALSTLAKMIASGCPGVLAGAPNEEVDPSSFTPRVRGERQRAELQLQTIQEELQQTIVAALDQPNKAAIEAFAAQVASLDWSDPTIAAVVRFNAASAQKALTPVPQVCADMRLWAQSGYHTLSPASLAFKAAEEARATMPSPTGSIKSLLRPYEDAKQRALVRATEALRSKTREALEVANSRDKTLERALGVPENEPEAAENEKVLGHGNTEAGESFVVRQESSRAHPGESCPRSVSVDLTSTSANGRSSSGSGSSVCLSDRSHLPPTGCGGDGVWSITAPVPASVWSVRLTLSSGRTLTSKVVRIPAREGGPGGVYVQSLRPHTPHPVSFTELDRHGRVVRVVKLPDFPCEAEGGSNEGPTLVPLAHGSTPGGEPFSIQGVLVHASRHQTFFTLELDTDANMTEGQTEAAIRATRPGAFGWSLATACPPHPFSIIYGTLAAPGASVSALTPEGLIPLTEVQLAVNLPAGGPLFYGAFSAAPTELVIKGANSEPLYTENVVTKAQEGREYCEGFGEEG
jgi:hypothetical protein